MKSPSPAIVQLKARILEEAEATNSLHLRLSTLPPEVQSEFKSQTDYKDALEAVAHYGHYVAHGTNDPIILRDYFYAIKEFRKQYQAFEVTLH